MQSAEDPTIVRHICPVCGCEYEFKEEAERCGRVPVWSSSDRQVFQVGERIRFSSVHLGFNGGRRSIMGTVLRVIVERASHRILSYRVAYSSDQTNPDREDSACEVRDYLVNPL